MKVKLIVGRSGDGWSQSPGEVIEVTNEEGKRLIEKQRAVPVREKREKATRKQQEER